MLSALGNSANPFGPRLLSGVRSLALLPVYTATTWLAEKSITYE